MKLKRLAALLLAGAMSVSMLTGCGINKNAVVATYNSKEVTLGIADLFESFSRFILFPCQLKFVNHFCNSCKVLLVSLSCPSLKICVHGFTSKKFVMRR